MNSALQDELDRILHHAAFARLSDRAFLRITGSDATRWLNGMVTNSIQSLAPCEGNYNFLLNAQGRIQGDCTIFREPEAAAPAFVLATSREQIETIQQLLDQFIIMDDVELAPMDNFAGTLLLIGPEAPDVLRRLENPALDPSASFADSGPLRLCRYPATGSQIITPAEGPIPCFELSTFFSLDNLIEATQAAGAVEASPEALNAVRILSGIPAFGTDIRDKDLPQETNQTHALHFSKGCYLGQEIVERIRSRGQVRRLFTRFRLEGELPATLPVTLEANGKPAGELTSAATIPLPDGPELFALGYARREALDTHQPLTYSGGTAVPSAPSRP